MITLTLLQSLGKDYLQSDQPTFSSPHHSNPKVSINAHGNGSSRQQTLISQISPKNQRGQIQSSNKFPSTKGSSDQTQIQQQQLLLQRRYVDFNNQQLQKQQKLQICKLLSSQIQQLDTQLKNSSHQSTPNFNQQRGLANQMMSKDPGRDNLEQLGQFQSKEKSTKVNQISLQSPKAVSPKGISKIFSPASFKENPSKVVHQYSKKSSRVLSRGQQVNHQQDENQRESYEEFYKLFPQDLSVRNSYQTQNDYYQRQPVQLYSDKTKSSIQSGLSTQECRRVGSKTQRSNLIQRHNFGDNSTREIINQKVKRDPSLKSPRNCESQNLRYSSRSSQKKSKASKELENQSQSQERGMQQNVNLIYTQHLRKQIIQQQKESQDKSAKPAKRLASRSTEKLVKNQQKQGYHTKQPSMKNKCNKDSSPFKRSNQTDTQISRNQGPQIYSNTFQQQQIQLEDLRAQLKEQRSPKVFSYGNTLTLNQQERSPISSNWTNHYIKQSQKQRERSPILSSSQSSQLKFKKLHAKQKSREVQSIAQLLSSPMSEDGVKSKDGSLKKNVIEFMKKQTQQPSQQNAKQSQPLISHKAYQEVSQFTIVDRKTSRNNVILNEKQNNSAAVFFNNQSVKDQKLSAHSAKIEVIRQNINSNNFNQKTSKSQVQIKVTGKNKSPKKNSQQFLPSQTKTLPTRGVYESLFQKVYRVTQEQLSSNMSLASSQHHMELDFQLFSDKITDSQTENQRYREESDLQEFMELERNLSSDKLRISSQFQQSQDERRQTVSSETPTLKKAESQIISANEMKDIAHKRSSTWQIQSQDANQRNESERLAAEVKSNYFSQEQFLSSDNMPKSTQSQDRGSDGNNYSIFNLQSKQPSINKGSHFRVPSIDFQSQNQQLQVSQLDIPSNDISSINNSLGSIKQQQDLQIIQKITQNPDFQNLQEKQDQSNQALRLFQTNQNQQQLQSLIQKAEELKRKFVLQQSSSQNKQEQELQQQISSSDISKQDSFTLQISADDEGQGQDAEVSIKFEHKREENRPLSKTGTQTSSMNTSNDVNHNCVVISINHLSSEEAQEVIQEQNIPMINEEDIIYIQNPICLESPRTNLDQQDLEGFQRINSQGEAEVLSKNDYQAYLKSLPSIPALVPSERSFSQSLGRDSKGSNQRNRDMPLQISCLKKPCLVSKEINHDERILFSIRDRKSSAKKRVTINLEQNEFNEFERPSSCSEIEVSLEAQKQYENMHSFEEESQEEIISQDRDMNQEAQSHHFFEQYDNEKLREEFLRLQLQKFDTEILQQRKQANQLSNEEAPFSFERVDEKLFIQNSLARLESDMLKEETHQSTEQTFSICENQLQSVDPRALETLYQYADILRESQESPYEMREEDEQNVTISFRQHQAHGSTGYIHFEQRLPEEEIAKRQRNSENDKSILTQEESLEIPQQNAPQMLQPNPLDIEVMQLTQQLHNYSSHSSMAQVIVSAVSPAKDRIRQVLRNRVSPMQQNQQNKIEFRRNAVSHLLKESAAEQHIKVQQLSHFLSTDELPLRVSSKVKSENQEEVKGIDEYQRKEQLESQEDKTFLVGEQIQAKDHSLQSIEINKLASAVDLNQEKRDEAPSSVNFKPLSSRIESFTKKYLENQKRIQESLVSKTSRPKASGSTVDQKQNFDLTRGILNSHRTNKQIYI